MIAKNKGAALIIVLMVIALITSIVASMSERLFASFQHAGQRSSYQQAYWYAEGAEAIAKVAISQSYKDNDTVNLSQPWAVKGNQFPVERGLISGTLRDAQACINVNAMYQNSTLSSYTLGVLTTLITTLSDDEYNAQIAAQSLKEFIDSDDEVQTQLGVEDNYYESMSPSYEAANTLLASVSEIRAVQGMSANIVALLSPYLCALPDADWRLNVNTLDVEHAALLSAMFSSALSVGDAQTLLESRPYAGWASVDDFLQEPQLQSLNEDMRDEVTAYLTTDSAYFSLSATVNVDDIALSIHSLLHSSDRENVAVVRRQIGGWSEQVLIPAHNEQ